MLTENDVFFRSMLQSCGTLVLNPCLFLRRTELNRIYSKPCVKRSLSKRQTIGFQDQLSLNAGQKYCRMLSTFICITLVIKILLLSIFEWPFYTGFTVHAKVLPDCSIAG